MSTRYIMICEARREYFDPWLVHPDVDGLRVADVVNHLVWKRWQGDPMEAISEFNDRFEEIWDGHALDPWTDALAEIARSSIEEPSVYRILRPEQAEIVLRRCAARLEEQDADALEELRDAGESGDVDISDDGCTIQWLRRDGEILVARGATPYEACREYRRLSEHAALEAMRRSSLMCEPVKYQGPAPVRGSFVTDVERVVRFSGMQVGGEIVTRLTIKVPVGGLVDFAGLRGRWVKMLSWVPRSLAGWMIVREHARNEDALMLVEDVRWDDAERHVTLLGRRDAGNGVEQAVRTFPLVRVDPVDAPDPLPAWGAAHSRGEP